MCIYIYVLCLDLEKNRGLHTNQALCWVEGMQGGGNFQLRVNSPPLDEIESPFVRWAIVDRGDRRFSECQKWR